MMQARRPSRHQRDSTGAATVRSSEDGACGRVRAPSCSSSRTSPSGQLARHSVAARLVPGTREGRATFRRAAQVQSLKRRNHRHMQRCWQLTDTDRPRRWEPCSDTVEPSAPSRRNKACPPAGRVRPGVDALQTGASRLRLRGALGPDRSSPHLDAGFGSNFGS